MRMAIPASMKSLFKELPLVSTESERDYLDLVEDIAAWLKPADRWQWRSVRQLADKYWELNRLQQYPRHLIQEGRRAALEKILEHDRDIGEIVFSSNPRTADFFRDPKSRKETYEQLGRYGLDDKSISARAFELKAGVLTDLHRLMGMIRAEIAILTGAYFDYSETKSLPASKTQRKELPAPARATP